MEAFAPQPPSPPPPGRPAQAAAISPTRRPAAGLVTRSLAISMVAVIAGAAHSWIVPVKLHPDPPAPATNVLPPVVSNPSAGAQPAPLGQYITLEQAKALYDAHQVLFIDTRPKEKFEESHIPSALHLSTEEFGQPQESEVLKFLSASEPYILYCDGGDCDASENVATRLQSAFPNYHILKDGFPAWQAAGYDVESGP